jgi:MarR family transcriptional regulator for hemolysin
MRHEFDRRVRSLGLTRAQWLFIGYLNRQPGCTQSELAESLQQHKITVSRQAKRLEKCGWIERRDRTNDGRAYGLFLTPQAERMQRRLDEAGAQLHDDFVRGLTPEQLTLLKANLFLILANLQQMETAAAKSHA